MVLRRWWYGGRGNYGYGRQRSAIPKHRKHKKSLNEKQLRQLV